jgi:GntR family transcriptional regulator, transcriptional repressor for pyruvate dehydrogenase complex
MSDRFPATRVAEPSGLAAQVVAYVRGYIATHRLKPGDRLPGETEIARALGVSRPVVREASRTLLALGSIETAPGRAPRVGTMDSHVLRHVFEHAIVTGEADARQVLEVRRGLEIAMAAQAAERRDDAASLQLSELSASMGERLREPEEFVALDLAFHRTLARATANPFYLVLIEACRAAFAASMDAGLRQRFGRAELERVHELHAEIVDAVRARDPVAAADAMTRHFDDALAALYRPARPRRRSVTGRQD